MKQTKAMRRPPIHMIDVEAETLTSLALGAENRVPEVSELLLREISRAHVHKAEAVPADAVTMLATVEFADEANGAKRTIQLVYPKDADIALGRVSILTLVGAGLIGLREGQSIIWPDRTGKERVFTINAVTRPTMAASA